MSSQGGNCEAYHARGVGSGCVQKWYSSAVKVCHVGSPDSSFTTPARNR